MSLNPPLLKISGFESDLEIYNGLYERNYGQNNFGGQVHIGNYYLNTRRDAALFEDPTGHHGCVLAEKEMVVAYTYSKDLKDADEKWLVYTTPSSPRFNSDKEVKPFYGVQVMVNKYTCFMNIN